MYLHLAQLLLQPNKHHHICKEPFDLLCLPALHEPIGYPLLNRFQGGTDGDIPPVRAEIVPGVYPNLPY